MNKQKPITYINAHKRQSKKTGDTFLSCKFKITEMLPPGEYEFPLFKKEKTEDWHADYSGGLVKTEKKTENF
jgi:hypothetical protein